MSIGIYHITPKKINLTKRGEGVRLNETHFQT